MFPDLISNKTFPGPFDLHVLEMTIRALPLLADCFVTGQQSLRARESRPEIYLDVNLKTSRLPRATETNIRPAPSVVGFNRPSCA
jgi:hypothetical protein